MAAEALRQTENDVNAATEVLNEKPELLFSAIQDRGSKHFQKVTESTERE